MVTTDKSDPDTTCGPSESVEEDKNVLKESFERLTNPDLIENLVNDLGGSGIVGEPGNVVSIILVFNSRLCSEPLNLAPQGESSIGKSHLVCKVSDVFARDTLVAGYLSRTSLIHGTEWATEIDKNTYLIDLKGKTIVLLEAKSNRDFLDLMKPIRSHDKNQISYRITEGQGKHSTKKVIIEGWPVFVAVSVNPSGSDEDSTRDLSLTPAWSEKKGKAVNLNRGRRAAFPWRSRPDKDVAEALRSWEFALRTYLKPAKVVNLWGERMAAHFEATNPRSMRDFKKLLSIFESSTLLHQLQRPVIECSDGERYAIGSVDDLRITAKVAQLIIEPTAKGLGSDVISAYYEFFSPFCAEPKTIREIMEAWRSHFGKTIKRTVLSEHYLYALRDSGLVYQDDSEKAHKWSTTSVGLSESVGVDFDRLMEDAKQVLATERIIEMLSSVDVSQVKYGDTVLGNADIRKLADDIVAYIRTPTVRQEFLDKLGNPLSSCLRFEKEISAGEDATDGHRSDRIRSANRTSIEGGV